MWNFAFFMLDAGPPVEFLILSSHDVMCLTNNIVSNTQTSTIEWYRIVFLTKKLKNTQQCSFRALAAGKIVELQNFWHQIQIPHPQISIKSDQACLYMKIWCFLKYVNVGMYLKSTQCIPFNDFFFSIWYHDHLCK